MTSAASCLQLTAVSLFNLRRDFPGGSDGKASAYNVGDLGLIPGSGRPLEKEMATHSSTLAWRIPGTEEPGKLQSMESQRAGHDFTFTFTLGFQDFFAF